MSSVLGLPSMTKPRDVSKAASESQVPTRWPCIITLTTCPLQGASLLDQVCWSLDQTVEDLKDISYVNQARQSEVGGHTWDNEGSYRNIYMVWVLRRDGEGSNRLNCERDLQSWESVLFDGFEVSEDSDKSLRNEGHWGSRVEQSSSFHWETISSYHSHPTYHQQSIPLNTWGSIRRSCVTDRFSILNIFCTAFSQISMQVCDGVSDNGEVMESVEQSDEIKDGSDSGCEILRWKSSGHETWIGR